MMKNNLREISHYAALIIRKWVLWIFAVLDIGAFVAQIFFINFHIPQIVFILITFVGLFWAGYQVYRDVVIQLPTRPTNPPPFEILPLSFELELNNQIPRVSVYLYIINYLSKELVLHTLSSVNLDITGGPSLSSIPLARETSLPSKNSKQIWCNRSLNEAEIKAIEGEQNQQRNVINATFSINTHATIGKKNQRNEFPSNSIKGRIS